MATELPSNSSLNLDQPPGAPLVRAVATPLGAPLPPGAVPLGGVPLGAAPVGAMPMGAVPGPQGVAPGPNAGLPQQPAPQAASSVPAIPDDEADSVIDWSVMIPSVLTSTVFHIVVVLALALISEPIEVKQQQEIVSTQTEEPPMVEDFQADAPLPEQFDPSDAAVSLDSEMSVDNADSSIELPETNDLSVAEVLSNDTAATTSDFLAPSGDLTAIIGPKGNVGDGKGLTGRKSSRPGKAKAGGGGSDTEKSVESALKWIASVQTADGGWNFDLKAGGSQATESGSAGTARCGATGIALLPFLAAGYTHKENSQYKQVVYRGLDYLVQHPTKKYTNIPAGIVSWHEPGGTMYSHGIAAMAMCEAYGMTKDKSLMPYAQGGMNFISAAQDPAKGGWRYEVRQPGDTSVVGWQLMALKSGAMAYLSVNPNTIKQATVFLNSVSDEKDDRAFYGYTSPGKSPACTAIGLIARLHLGWKRENEGLNKGVKYLAAAGPSQGNYYFNYYATQVMFQYDGDEWVKWNDKMKGMLLKNQSTKGANAGSWHPADYSKAGPDHTTERGGRLCTTALGCMILEVYYRYSKVLSKNALDESFPL